MSSTEPTFGELLGPCRRSAVHLEMRDVYYGTEKLVEWQRGQRVDWADRDSWWGPFYQDVADAVARGVTVRRARIVSEPVTDYIRYEHYWTYANVAAGEQVRWLPRRHTTDLCLPGNDFWVFDADRIRIHHFSGDGDIIEREITDDGIAIEHCAAAFEAVWARAIPHEEYKV